MLYVKGTCKRNIEYKFRLKKKLENKVKVNSVSKMEKADGKIFQEKVVFKMPLKRQ